MTIVRMSSGLILWSQPLAPELEREDDAARRARFFSLTPAELEVFLLAMRGLDNRGIAARRGCSVRTVAVLLARAFGKLGVSGRIELIANYGELLPPEHPRGGPRCG
jgi:DNA-binding CsgD family transcriptional regulator